MPLIDVELTERWSALPDEVAVFLAEADLRISEFGNQPDNCVHGFVPCDFVALYHALRNITNRRLTAGDDFCEWGSGFGVVAALAAMLGMDAVGIEIDRDLCDAADELARDFGVAVEFINGSFIPRGADALIDRAYVDFDGAMALDSRTDDTYDQLDLEICDFDLIFAFPWPNDEILTAELFDRFAADGALLLTYHETNGVRLRRKKRRRG